MRHPGRGICGCWEPQYVAVLLFPAGIVLIEDAWGTSALLQVAFAWTMSFGLIGLFRRFMARRSLRVHAADQASRDALAVAR